MSALKSAQYTGCCQQNSGQGRSNMSVEDDGVGGSAAVAIGGVMGCAKRVERVACGQ